MALQAVSDERDAQGYPLPYSAATLQHIGLLKRKREQLHAAQIEAEEQFLHSLARSLAAGEITTAELAMAFDAYRSVAAPGFKNRWNAALPISAAKMHQWPNGAPNGPGGSWSGVYPFETGPVPRYGVCVVYVLFDTANEPCYVGSTSAFRDRLSDHRRSGKCFVRWTAFPCTGRESAYQLEERLLREHQPYLNKKRGR